MAVQADRLPEAIDAANVGIEVGEALFAEDSANVSVRESLGSARANRALLHWFSENPDAALSDVDEALTLLDPIAESRLNMIAVSLAGAHRVAADARLDRNEIDQSLEQVELAIDVSRRFLEAYPSVPSYMRIELAVALTTRERIELFGVRSGRATCSALAVWADSAQVAMDAAEAAGNFTLPHRAVIQRYRATFPPSPCPS